VESPCKCSPIFPERFQARWGAASTALREQGVISDSTARALRKSVGLRNIAVHDYVAVNWQIVHDVVE
jgi:uncharacterized protein YutE (UPF0331/DUF86 family)